MQNIIEYEQSLLGCLLISYKSFSDIEHFKFTKDDFYYSNHKSIFQAIRILSRMKVKWDAIIVLDTVKKLKGYDEVSPEYLTKLSSNTPGLSNLVSYAEIVKEQSILRKLSKALVSANENINSGTTSTEIFNACLKSINALRDSKLISSHKESALSSSFESFMAYIEKRRLSESSFEGIISTLPTVDNLTSGFCAGHMIVVAARPSVGKSALGLYFAGRALMQGKHVLFWSTEMNNNTILARLFSNFCIIKASNLTHFPKNLTENEITKLEEWKDDFDTLYVESGYPNIQDLCDKAKKMRKKGMLDILIVDYLQNIRGEGEGTLDKLSNVSNSLKSLAMELDIPVIALAQLNRQAQHLDVPTMAEIKGSGSIEQDADLVFIIHQNSNEAPEKHWLICSKNRHGETKNIPIIFDKPYQDFKEDNSPHRNISKKSNKESL